MFARNNTNDNGYIRQLNFDVGGVGRIEHLDIRKNTHQGSSLGSPSSIAPPLSLAGSPAFQIRSTQGAKQTRKCAKQSLGLKSLISLMDMPFEVNSGLNFPRVTRGSLRRLLVGKGMVRRLNLSFSRS
jgi:hypothetical protein